MQGISATELRTYIIRPVLRKISLWSIAAENILLGTAAQESHMGYYLHQQNGPALGIYQIEPKTHDDVWENYLNYRPELKTAVGNFLTIQGDKQQELIFNLNYASVIARLIYYRAPKPLPNENNLEALAQYWKQYYNTASGKGTIADFINNYKKFVTT